MKHRGQHTSHIVDFLFVLSLFCVFTICAFLVVMIGANVYRSTAENMENTYSTRTALAYVTEKIRSHDAEGLMSLTEVEGTPALAFYDRTETKDYVTYIYSDSKALFEITASPDTEVSLSMGQEIIKVNGFSFTEKEDGFICLSASDSDGNITLLYVHLQNSSGYTAATS